MQKRKQLKHGICETSILISLQRFTKTLAQTALSKKPKKKKIKKMTLNDWISGLLYFIHERALSTIAVVEVDDVKGQFALHVYII